MRNNLVLLSLAALVTSITALALLGAFASDYEYMTQPEWSIGEEGYSIEQEMPWDCWAEYKGEGFSYEEIREICGPILPEAVEPGSEEYSIMQNKCWHDCMNKTNNAQLCECACAGECWDQSMLSVEPSEEGWEPAEVESYTYSDEFPVEAETPSEEPEELTPIEGLGGEDWDEPGTGAGWGLGEASATVEPVSVATTDILRIQGSAGAADQLVKTGWLIVTPNTGVDVAKLVLTLTNADQLRGYFNQLDIVLAKSGTGGREIKAVFGIYEPTTVMVLDKNDLSSGAAFFDAIVYYEIREGALFDTLPLYIDIRVAGVS
ncbi:hypothetical protein [Pyrodictium abyssi]|uniref:Cohesin domain-containing protein n=1 Tax=Pyrodictium abyssi TaxID=54256 RepID=A0ABM8ITP4_9CREN|nr:hypothetical protein PABY_04860 [Pyrodictium abyssi]